MNKILATIIKEWLLLKRDAGGLLLLFLMPAVLIIIMALIQDAPFKDYQQMRFDLLLADNDRGSLAQEVKTGLKQSKNFNVIDSWEGKPLTEEKLKELLGKGNYSIGIVIPQGATAEMVNASNIIANSIAKKLGIGMLPAREVRNNVYIRLYFDPVTKPAFRSAISYALDKYITYSSSSMLVQRMSKLSKIDADTSEQEEFSRVFGGIGIKEEMLNKGNKYNSHVNSVQHNVPAWAIFGMFFIVIPMASHLIRERQDGSATRLSLIPGSQQYIAAGKITFYTLVCFFQFVVMVCIGIWVLPLLDLPALYLGHNPFSLIPVVLCIGFAATAYGYFIGTVFNSINQAMPFGAISIVILSALGGIWVPIDILPFILQKIALASPLHWSLDSIQHLVLRDGSIADIWLNLAILLVLGTVLYQAGIYALNRKRGS
jgi:ABC-2 type transport system permease protein